ncbi:hypothetical protein [Micromonospora sp. NPDC005174]|uniref:hypothetical protein n=1 Tax=Micromonospora sp. NPDC005174 TaxID=3157018 RepID=UPI0033BC56E3
MAVPAGKDSVAWVDGVVLYRDDVERLAKMISEHLPEDLRRISVRYRNRDAVEENGSAAPIGDI